MPHVGRRHTSSHTTATRRTRRARDAACRSAPPPPRCSPTTHHRVGSATHILLDRPNEGVKKSGRLPVGGRICVSSTSGPWPSASCRKSRSALSA